MAVAVAIFAHQEERRIGACLASLPLDRPDTYFHVLVNGTTDATVARATAAAGGRTNVIVHNIKAGGKSRTWNHMVHNLLTGTEEAVIFMDGDAQIVAGSIDALVADLATHPHANASAGMPMNGRMADFYRHNLKIEGGLFGDLYALSGPFVAAIRARGLRLPDDLIGDDGLVAAWAHTNLASDADWQHDRLLACDAAGFLCEQVSLARPSTWAMQYKRFDKLFGALLSEPDRVGHHDAGGTRWPAPTLPASMPTGSPASARAPVSPAGSTAEHSPECAARFSGPGPPAPCSGTAQSR